MNQKTIAIAAVLMAAALTGLFATSSLAYAEGGDESETSTDQSVKQKNTGSGDSANFNCAENLIKAGVGENDCEFGNGGDGGMNGGGGNGGEEALFCHNPEGGPVITQSLPPQAIEAHLNAQENDVPGHEGDHIGACLPGET
jgi:hypothetical protein